MGNNSRQSIINAMKAKPSTFDWDAVVCYSRNKVNALLAQQYLARYRQNDALPPLDGVVQIGDTTITLSSVTLSAPRLSFENANLDNSQARLTYGLLGAKIVDTSEPDSSFKRVTKITNANAAALLTGPKLLMDITLKTNSGGVGSAGEVYFNIVDGFNFRGDFVDSEEEQLLIGNFFRDWFNGQEEKYRRYSLGQLDAFSNDVMTPQGFKLLTQPDPHESGSGAVVLFIVLRDGQYMGLPTQESGMPYFIPDDVDANGDSLYSAAAVFSNELIFNRVIKPQVNADMGSGLILGNPNASGALVAEQGELSYKNFEHRYTVRSGDFDAKFWVETLSLPFSAPTATNAFSVSPADNLLRVSWNNQPRSPWGNVIEWTLPTKPEYQYGDLIVTHAFSVDFIPSIDPVTHVVSFERKAGSSFTLSESGYEQLDFFDQPSIEIHNKLDALIRPELTHKFNTIKAPDINTFMVNNLLFPEGNTLRVMAVDLPCDMAVFGQLAPDLTSFQISPLETSMLAGATLQFVVNAVETRRAQDLEWSVASIDGVNAGVGVIDAAGLYTAPAAEDLGQSFVRVLVTAKDTGGTAMASALVTVVASSLSVNPVFQSCGKDRSTNIQVESLGASELDVQLICTVDHGATLTADPGTAGTYVYQPGTTVPGHQITVDIAEFTDKANGVKTRAYVLVSWLNLSGEMVIDENAGVEGVQLVLMDSGWGDPTPIESPLEWALTGEGSVDQNGIFTEPAQDEIKDGIAIITAREGSSSRDLFGYLVLPLPLERFARHARSYRPQLPALQTTPASVATFSTGARTGKGSNSRDTLLSWMQGKTVTYGWNAVITYSRAKINRLLEQQYVSKFSTDSFLPPIFGTVSLDPTGNNRERLELAGLVLSAPRISFETSDLLDSRVVVTLDIVSGSVAYQSYPDASPPYLKSSFNISIQQQFKVQMEVDLAAVTGEVDKEGNVVVDLGEGYNFTSDLVTQEYPQAQLGLFFKNLFKAQPASARTYLLGVLDYVGDDMLTPSNFYIRTQSAPSGKNINSSSYGDGGVVLFIRTRNDFYDGTLPTPENAASFRYLIPDDEAMVSGQPDYSGSIVLSSRMVFENVLKPYLQRYIARGLSLSSSTTPGSSAILKATNGRWNSGNVHFQKQADIWGDVVHELMLFDIYFPFSPSLAVQVSADARELSITMSESITHPYHYKLNRKNWEDFNIRDNADFTYMLTLTYAINVDAALNKISFSLTGSSFDHTMQLQNFEPRYDEENAEVVHTQLKDFIQSEMQRLRDLFFNIELPELDFKALNHLLFPGQNVFLATEAYAPGDVVLFGQIDPTRTSFTLEPLHSIIKVGDRQRFEARQLTRAAVPMTWTVTSIDGSRAQGVIDQTGEFTAPPLHTLEGSAVRNVITASYDDPVTGQSRSASALVTVVAESMAVAPAMSTLSIRNPKPVELRASSLGAGPLQWRLLDSAPGTLDVAADSLTAVYTAPTQSSEEMLPVLVEVQDSGTGETVLSTILLLSGNYSLEVEPVFHPGLARTATVQLSVSEDDEEDFTYQWSVATGEGTVDDTGLFTAPDDISMPYSVIRCQDKDHPSFSGYSVVHLSNMASRPGWSDFTTFTIKPESPTKMAYANGLQQVQVRIAIKTKPTDTGEETALTPAERASLTLVVADTKEVLPQVDSEGVPISDNPLQWGVNAKRNEYDFYTSQFPPAEAQATPLDLDGDAKTLYIQTRSDTELRIAARVTRADNTFFYSTDHSGSEENDAIIVIQPLPVPVYQESEYNLDVRRAQGDGDPKEDADFDWYLTTVDYYYLRLLRESTREPIAFKTITFERAFSAVQWESRQYAEEVGSYTGYALPKSSELNFEFQLYNGIPDAVKPGKVVRDGYQGADGEFLFSLHRRIDFPFDENSELAQPIRMRLLDRYGNPHRLQLEFAGFNNRNKLVIKRISND
ncbi:hypothetical protein [Pseudomonas abietaniphila]|uniref:hypothetical protein n=1 Tax=Pseudomonas abietaniphila TaxID=89065 RepID=UPI00078266AC|nr:hypothetical protein [Pseudomonas abietaniphila]